MKLVEGAGLHHIIESADADRLDSRIDGAMAGAFLARFKALVENPQQLMLDML